MIETIYYCDRCKKRITGTIQAMSFGSIYTDENRFVSNKYMVRHMCMQCSENLFDEICDKYLSGCPDDEEYDNNFITREVESAEEAAAEEEKEDESSADEPAAAEETPVPSTDAKKRASMVFDMPKMIALRRAVWTLKNIAIEFGVSDQTISNKLKVYYKTHPDVYEELEVKVRK